MVEKAGIVAWCKLDISSAGRSSLWQQQPECGGGILPSLTSPLDRPAPSPHGGGWHHHDTSDVRLGILLTTLKAWEAEQLPVAAPAMPRVSVVTIASSTQRRATQLEVSELRCSGRCATGLCGSRTGAATFRVTEFLARCYMCRRPLHGKDIFTYTGERAFCSCNVKDK